MAMEARIGFLVEKFSLRDLDSGDFVPPTRLQH